MQILNVSIHLPGIRRRGFTIIELLIVIVVIAILATITVVAYNAVIGSAADASIKSDLKNASDIVQLDKLDKGKYPLDATEANGGKGFQLSDGNVITYVNTGNDFCISIANPRAKSPVRFTGADRRVENGVCAATNVTTLAGSGTPGFANGTGAAAQFNQPGGLAVDAAGVVYVADMNNNRIRKIMPDGTASVFAGSGTPGYANGTGAAAQFNMPGDIVIDATGTLYVTDLANNLVRKITPGGVVSTFAGSGVFGSSNGTGTAAQFGSPSGIAIDATGTLYVAEMSNNLIRKITPGGVVSTFAGSGAYGSANGTGTAAQFGGPRGITIDSAGTVYVSDSSNFLIRKITPGGVVSTLAGSLGVTGSANGTGTAAQFNFPGDLTVDSTGAVYVADTGNNSIRKITQSGVVSTFAGSTASGYVDGASAVARFYGPLSIINDAADNFYVTDGSNARIRKITTQ